MLRLGNGVVLVLVLVLVLLLLPCLLCRPPQPPDPVWACLGWRALATRLAPVACPRPWDGGVPRASCKSCGNNTSRCLDMGVVCPGGGGRAPSFLLSYALSSYYYSPTYASSPHSLYPLKHSFSCLTLYDRFVVKVRR